MTKQIFLLSSMERIEDYQNAPTGYIATIRRVKHGEAVTVNLDALTPDARVLAEALDSTWYGHKNGNLRVRAAKTRAENWRAQGWPQSRIEAVRDCYGAEYVDVPESIDYALPMRRFLCALNSRIEERKLPGQGWVESAPDRWETGEEYFDRVARAIRAIGGNPQSVTAQ